MSRVYLLANVIPGKERSIRDTLRGIGGIRDADVITGQYDLVATIEAKDTNEIFNKILKRVRKVRGLTRTETFVAME
ncbi:MAG: Lrp/AsnC ligand binding domain-containing protein [Nitrospiraceae bacterium]|nr:Lrp/AsnC ligand binding domain-containing protein [Nitrospiraceae bacterium]